MVLSYNGILYSNQKEQMTGACNHIDESHRCYVEWKKPEKNILHDLHDLIYMKFKNKQNKSMFIKIRMVVLLRGDTNWKGIWWKLWGARTIPYLHLGEDYRSVEKSKKIIRLYNENNYTLYALLCTGYL